jgi:enoyl-CoA hydratase/carnithine racemase
MSTGGTMADVLVEKQGQTTIFTINGPERMNTIGRTVRAELTAGLQEFQAGRDQIRRHHHGSR